MSVTSSTTCARRRTPKATRRTIKRTDWSASFSTRPLWFLSSRVAKRCSRNGTIVRFHAMALTATVFNVSVEFSDVDRGIYETLELKLAQHPSETTEYMLTRLLGYCLEYEEGIAFTQGLSSGDEPAILIRDLTGRITAWIEVGMPDAERLHRASKLTDRVAVYTHRNIRQIMLQLEGKTIHRGEEIPIIAFDKDFISGIAGRMERRTKMSLLVTERHLYVEIAGQTFNCEIEPKTAA